MIHLDSVTKLFPNEETGQAVQALQDINLAVEQNEFVCLLGPSGCGKSTLLNLVAGFEPPTSGRVLFEGKPVRAAGPERGVVFQEPTLFPWLTVEQNVDFGLRNIGLESAARKAIVQRFVSLVGLSEFARARPHQLSGGMKQRVQLARVLALDPRALLMDEPFGALDAQTRDRLQDELLGIWERDRKTVLFVTHNVEEALYLADRVVVLAPAPDGVTADVPILIPRPRDRYSSEMREATMALTAVLADLPCCVLPSRGLGEVSLREPSTTMPG
ncbi:MAG: ABC transporter ATP-binding protein [Armatimonadota bacterium]|nr:MAG: ABC transporter ATP-binding protein [Armatimonadota bacterium]